MKFLAAHMKLLVLSAIDDPGRSCDRTTGGLIFLRVQKQKEADIGFRINRNTPLQVLMSDYCNQMDLVFKDVTFTFDGNRVMGHQTPADLKLEDDDIIEAWTEQSGRWRESDRCNPMEFSASHMKLSIISLVDRTAAVGSGDGTTNGGIIFLRVQKQKETDICYRIYRNMPLRFLMSDYCNQMGLIFEAVRFTFEGRRVMGHRTARFGIRG